MQAMQHHNECVVVLCATKVKSIIHVNMHVLEMIVYILNAKIDH